jgi:hypothetical protein
MLSPGMGTMRYSLDRHLLGRGYTKDMTKKATKKQIKLPKTTPEFEQAIKALAHTPPICNKELVQRNKRKS